jgi:ribonuclease BN (tRNA processing enzyme)
MILTILGSGTSVPHPARSSAANWLQTAGGSILLDISADAPHRMAQEKLDWPNLDAIWVSHFHLDHIGGLTPFLFGLRWAPQTRSRTKPMRIFGGVGLQKLLTTIDESNNYKLFKQTFPIEVIELERSTEFEILPGVHAQTLATPHTQESMALRLNDQDSKSFVYTSDTGFSENLVAFARDCDLLLMECSFRSNKPMESHLELKDAIQLAGLCNPRHLVLTHLYAEWDGVDLVAEVRQLWPGRVSEARDGLRLEI